MEQDPGKQKWVQAISNFHQAIMESRPDKQEVYLGNQKPLPDNHGTKSRYPGTNANPGNLRKLLQATMDQDQARETFPR